jgi:hypothetical protein
MAGVSDSAFKAMLAGTESPIHVDRNGLSRRSRDKGESEFENEMSFGEMNIRSIPVFRFFSGGVFHLRKLQNPAGRTG